jgi:hypothetical protein
MSNAHNVSNNRDLALKSTTTNMPRFKQASSTQKVHDKVYFFGPTAHTRTSLHMLAKTACIGLAV